MEFLSLIMTNNSYVKEAFEIHWTRTKSSSALATHLNSNTSKAKGQGYRVVSKWYGQCMSNFVAKILQDHSL